MVDAFHGPRYSWRPRTPTARLLLLLAAAGGTTSCGGTRQVVVIGPPVDATQVALRSEDVTRLREPSRIVFAWSLAEQGVRVSGRGVARVEPSYKARLDLFLSNGETAARAAMVDDDLRIPEGVPEGILPPSHLMWATLGVFRPGLGTGLVGGDEVEGGGVRLRYRLGNGDEVRYVLDTSRHIREVEVLRGGTAIQRVILEGGEGPFPEAIVYRDLTAFRELRITRETVERVEPFPPDIWLR